MNILKIAFDDKQLDKEKLEKVFEKIQAGRTFWSSVDEFIAFSIAGEYTWLEENGDSIDLGGGVLPQDFQVVDFDVWYEQAMKVLGGETVTKKKEEKILGIPEGYIPHDGKSVVGDKDRKVEIVVREGDVLDGKVGEFRWNHYGNDRDIVAYRFLDNEPAPVRNPRPRYRKRARQKPTTAKTIVRVLYTTQQVYTFKNVRSVQIIDDKVYIQHERDITEGIKENSESEINGDLVMAVVIHEVGNRSNFFRNIDGTWDFQAEDGTVINSGKQLGRVFKK